MVAITVATNVIVRTGAQGVPGTPGTAAVAAHNVDVGAHTALQLRSEKDSPNGYAGLDAGTKLDGSQVPYGAAADTACEGDDARLSDDRVPTGAATGDLAGTYSAPSVAAVTTTTGPTSLVIGAIADGEALVRSGATLVGSAMGVGDVVSPGGETAGRITKFTGSKAVAETATTETELATAVTHSTTVTGNPHSVDATDVGAEPAGAIATHAALSDAHHPQVHTIVSHDTTATGSDLTTLTDGSNADPKHIHAIADAHIADVTTNPHAVTAAQAGAEPAGSIATHAALSDAHHPQVHTILSHDTDTTGSELTSLYDGSDVTTSHVHSQYAELAGATFTGAVAGIAPAVDASLTTKGYVDSVVQGIEWQDSVLDRDLTAPPGAPTAGDRYIVATGGTGDWATHDDEITEWDGAAWVFTVQTVGMTVAVDDENRNIRWSGSAWVFLGTTVDHQSLIGSGTLTHANLDAQTPVVDEKAALAGTDGTPSASNKYVTNSDPRNSDARVPTAHTIVSHDTDTTGAELTTLADGSDADALHVHAIADAHIADMANPHGITGNEDLITGVIWGGIVTVNGGDPAQFDVSAGFGIVVDWSDPTSPPIRTPVSFGPFTAEAIPNVSLSFTSLYVDSAGLLIKDSGGSISAVQRKTLLRLQGVVHQNLTTITSISTDRGIGFQVTASLIDYINKLGGLNEGNRFFNASTDLTIAKTAGTTTLPFVNSTIDTQDATTKVNALVALYAIIPKLYRDGIGDFTFAFGDTGVNPDLYDDGSGTLATVGNNRWTVKRFYFTGIADSMAMVYGQATYANSSDAIAAISTENPEVTPALETGQTILTTFLVVKKGATDLSSADAVFIDNTSVTAGSGTGSAPGTWIGLLDTIPGTLIGNAGLVSMVNVGETGLDLVQLDHATDLSNVGSNTHAQVDTHIADTTNPHATTLQAAYDSSAVDPEISTNDTNGALEIRRGTTGGDGDKVFGVENAAGTTTACITGDGDVQSTHVTVTHTAIESDEHALIIDVDAAGFGDVKAIDINYVTGAIGAGIVESTMLVNIDETLSTGGRVAGVEVLTTQTAGGPEVCGLEAGIGVDPIKQISGVFADLDSILVLAVDETTDLSGGGAGNVAAFTLDNDTMTFGSAATFEELEFILDTPSSNPGIAPTFEFSTGVGTWTAFSPSDGTNAMRATGVVAWLSADIPTWAIGTGSEFLIRITRTRNSLGTTPILDLVQAAAGLDYSWDKDGDLTIAGVLSSAAIKDSTDITKALKFDVSGITTATTRTITVPDADITIDGTTDARTPAVHGLGGAEHSSATLAQLNALVSDATLDTSTAARPPNGAASGDLGGTYPSPTVNDGADSTAIHDNVAGEILAIALKATPGGPDVLVLEDVAAANVKKRTTAAAIAAAGPPALHAATHSDGGTDEIKIENIGATSTDATKVFGPDGSGGVEIKTPSGGLPSHYYTALDVLVVNADYSVSGPMNANTDTANAAIDVLVTQMSFNTLGVGIQLPPIPAGAVNMQITIEARSKSAPTGTDIAKTLFYERNETTAIGSWSSSIALDDISLSTQDYVNVTTDKALAAWGLTAGDNHRIEIVATVTGSTMSGDLYIKGIRVDFT